MEWIWEPNFLNAHYELNNNNYICRFDFNFIYIYMQSEYLEGEAKIFGND